MDIIVLNKYKADITVIEKEIVKTNKKMLEDYNGNDTDAILNVINNFCSQS